MNYTPSYLGLVSTGILILVFIIMVLYYLIGQKYKPEPGLVLMLLLLFTIAVGIHSLQHEGQEKKNNY
jgi:L-asparagine transporter-like permease